jgi:dipeptide transport system ATP-binding protein
VRGVSSKILNLLADPHETLNLSYIFISHDLSVVKFFADRALVMQRGEVVEQDDTKTLFRDPRHDYSRSLLQAVPRVDLDAIRRRVAARRAAG